MNQTELKKWIENGLKWHWDMTIGSDNILTVKIIFDSAFPKLDDGVDWAARAYFIAPVSCGWKLMRGVSDNRHVGGEISNNIPLWYPLEKITSNGIRVHGGWVPLREIWYPELGTDRPAPFILGYGRHANFLEFSPSSFQSSMSWRPLNNSNFYSVMEGYAYNLCANKLGAMNYCEDPNIQGTQKWNLTERGKIRRTSFDAYFSVCITFMNNNLDFTCRSYGVPRHFISGDLLK